MNDSGIEFVAVVVDVLQWTPVPEQTYAPGYAYDDDAEDPGEPIPALDLREVFA